MARPAALHPLPTRCVCCGAVLPTGERLCETCSERIARIEAPVCLLCGQSLQDCSRKHPKTAYKEITAPFYYEDAIREGIHRFKFRDRPQYAAYFAQEMAASIRPICLALPLTRYLRAHAHRKGKRARL